MIEKTFPEPVVRELRRENKRRRQRCASLEEALKSASLALAVVARGGQVGDVAKLVTDGMRVNEDCTVSGLDGAVDRHMGR